MNRNKKKTNALKAHCLLIAAMLLFNWLNAQGWRVNYGSGVPGSPYFDDGTYLTGVHELSDGNYSTVNNHSESTAIYFYGWFSDTGNYHHSGNPYFIPENPDFHHFSRHSLLLPNDASLILEEKLPFGGGQRDIWLTRYAWDPTLNPPHDYYLDWHKQVFAGAGTNSYAHSVAEVPGTGYAVLGSVELTPANSSRDVLLVKTAADGTPEWTKVFQTQDNDSGVRVLSAAGDGFFILKSLRPESDTFRYEAHLMKTDNNGNLLWDSNLSGTGSDLPMDMLLASDGNLVISGLNIAAGSDVFLMKVAPDGTALWRHDYLMPGRYAEGRCVVEDANGDLVIAGRFIDSTSMESDVLLMKAAAGGASLWERNLGRPNRDERIYDLAATSDGGYILGGSSNPDTWPLALLIKTDFNGIVKPGLISGNVFNDLDAGCVPSAGDLPLEDWIVEAFQDSSKIFYGTTDDAGNYHIECDTGDYIVRVIRPVDYWAACADDVAVHVGYLDSVNVDFPLQAVIECPYLTVDHASTLVRPCDTTTFTVHYCNPGTETAADASVEVALDDVFAFLESDIPPSSQNGNLLTFPLGDIATGECNSFQFSVLVDCDAPLGTTACSEVHIFPDSLCLPPDSIWSGAFVRAIVGCYGDSVRFTLINTGAQPMAEQLEYIVIEDAVLLMEGQFQLNQSETMDIPVPADGSTFHLIAQQEPGAPGNSLPLAAIEGCAGSGGGSPATGFFNQFPQNDADPFLSVYCPTVLNAYDPNDKQAFPTGFDDEHFIEANTELEYLVRFQNTGNDTAFRVIILDTLSSYLDPATVRPGASSHPYSFEMEDNGVLRFTFQDIELPDSNVNLAASQGYISFRVAQKSDNPAGTVIENNAGIYFNFNVPVITNTTFHTIHERLFEVVSVMPKLPDVVLQVAAYPNPFSDRLQIEISGEEIPDAIFQLYNSTGQLVKTLPLSQNKASLHRDGLAPGIYFFALRDNKRLIGSGQVVVK